MSAAGPLSQTSGSQSPFVFPAESPSRWFQEVCTAAKIPNFIWHCLRHTFASRLVMAGVDLRTVHELVGHRSIDTTTRYAHLAGGGEGEAVQRLVSSTSTATSTGTSGPQENRITAVV
jgi:integrase